MKNLRQITVIGMGLLGASVTLAVKRCTNGIKTVGFSHRPSTRQKARQLGIADNICDDMNESVTDSDLVILATPICTFENIFKQIAGDLKPGCIVTDVGSTKTLPHQWAQKSMGRDVHYVGSHPIAGSEKRGVEFARDDLFYGSMCILTKKKNTNGPAMKTVRRFWEKIGCKVYLMSPAAHDRIFARVSHLPHLVAAALINANDSEEMTFAGKGFIDTSRVASGPANIWTDIFTTNSDNVTRSIDKMIAELTRLKKAIGSKNEKQIEKLLDKARSRRSELINYKIRNKELL